MANDSRHFSEIWRAYRAWRGQVDRLAARSIDSGGPIEIERETQRIEWLNNRPAICTEDLQATVLVAARLKCRNIDLRHGAIEFQDRECVIGEIVVDRGFVPQN